MSEQRDNRKTENKHVESSLLFAIFKYGVTTFEIIRGLVEVEDFAFPNYRQIYNILNDEYLKTNNLVSFSGFYNFAIGLPEIGDEDKVKIKASLLEIKESKIADIDCISYAQQLKEHSHNRKIVKAMAQTVAEVGVKTSKESVQDLELKIDIIKKSINYDSNIELVSLKGNIEQRILYLQELKNNPEQAGVVWTGFKNFDNFNPPLKPGSFAMFQARTNMGKSMFLMGVALSNYCGVYSRAFHKPEQKGKVKGIKVIIITIEMSANEYAFRMDSHITKFKHTEEFSLAHIVESPAKLQSWRDKIKDYGNNDTDLMIYGVPENCSPAVVDKIISDNPFKPDLVVVDYIGDMISGLKNVVEQDWKSQAHLYTKMKSIARKHKCVIFSAQQTNRGAKKISDETGASSDKASSIADLLIAIEQSDSDKLHIHKGTDGNTIEGRLTAREFKVRSGVRLITYIIPEFYKMNWIEDEFEFAKEAGDYKNIETKTVKNTNPIVEVVDRPTLDKFPDRVRKESDINYEIGIEDVPTLVNTTAVNPDAMDDSDIEKALAEAN